MKDLPIWQVLMISLYMREFLLILRLHLYIIWQGLMLSADLDQYISVIECCFQCWSCLILVSQFDTEAKGSPHLTMITVSLWELWSWYAGFEVPGWLSAEWLWIFADYNLDADADAVGAEDDSGSSREGDPSPVMRGVGPSAQFTNHQGCTSCG